MIRTHMLRTAQALLQQTITNMVADYLASF